MKKKTYGFLYYLSIVSELGFVMAGSILVGLGLGLFIDSKFRTAPWGLLVCLLTGIFGAFVVGYQMITKKLK